MIHKTLEDAQESMNILGYDSLEEMYEAEQDAGYESMQWMFARKQTNPGTPGYGNY